MSNEQAGNEFENMQLGEIAVKLGYITRDQLDTLLRDIENSTVGSRYLIGELLVQKNLLSKKQLKHILSLQNRIMLNCEHCRKRFSIKNYNPDKNYKCPHCSDTLVLPHLKSQHTKKRKSERQKKVTDKSNKASKSKDSLFSSSISEIAKNAFSMTNEPFDRYSEFLRSFSDDKDEEAREVREIIDTNSEEIVVLADEDDDFEAEFSINDAEDYSGGISARDRESSIAQVDDSFVVGTETNFYQSGISVLKILEEERGVRASVDLSTDPQTERHLKKLKRIDSVSKYIVYDEVGRGGMGVVKLAYDQDIRRQIATKIIHPSSKEVPSKQERFLEEAQITGQLEHPNIVPVHDLGIDKGGNLFFTMKLVKGKSLLDVIELVADKKDGYHKYFTVTRFLQIFMKVCDAVAFAHSRGVLHRDLKPENIMVGDYGEVMVMDWGLAKVRGLPDKRVDQVSTDRSEGKIHQTLDGSIVGTPGYMAPEQARGDLDDVNEQSDIYSLGAILYEILTSKQAFPGSDSSKVIQKVKRHKFLPPSVAAPSMNIPRELEHVILNAMAFNPEDRYLTVNQLKEEIEAYIDGRVLSSVNYSMFQLFIKWFTRNMTSLIIAVIFGLSFLIMAIIWANDLSKERDEALNKSNELLSSSSELKSEINRLKEKARKSDQLVETAKVVKQIHDAIKNNNLRKLKALKSFATPKYKQLIEYIISVRENRVIEKTQKKFFGNVSIAKSADEEMVVVASDNNLSIYENLNSNPISAIELKAKPNSFAISEDGTTIVVTFNGGEYQVYDSFGSKMGEKMIEGIDIAGSFISPLCDYIAFKTSDGNIKIVDWHDNVVKTIEDLDSNIISNIQFFSDEELCFSLDNKDFVVSSWDNDFETIDTKVMHANAKFNKITVSGSTVLLVDTNRWIYELNINRLRNINTSQDINFLRKNVQIKKENYAFDAKNAYLWELSKNVLVCRNANSGNLLKKYLISDDVEASYEHILKLNNEIFIIADNGQLYKLANNQYMQVPAQIGNNFEVLKLWSYKKKIYMLTECGIYSLVNGIFELVSGSKCNENIIKSYSYVKDDFMFMQHKDGQISVYNLFNNKVYRINDFTLADARFIEVVKNTAGDEFRLIAMNSNNNLSCFAVDMKFVARRLWDLRVKYAEKSSFSIVSELNKIFVLEFNNQLNIFDLTTGMLEKELLLSHKANEVFVINSGKTLLTRGPDNFIRIVDFDTMETLQTYQNNHLTEIKHCYVDKSLQWLITVSDEEVNLRTFADNQNVLTLKNYNNGESVFIDSSNQQIFYVDSNSHTLESLDIAKLSNIFIK